MKFFRNLTITCSAVLTLSLPALAGVTVNSPANDAGRINYIHPVGICMHLFVYSVDAMGYSFDQQQ